MANKTGQGRIEELISKEKRVNFKIGGKYYSWWAQGEEEEEITESLQRIITSFKGGDYVEFNYTEKANPNGGSPYKNIVSMKKIAAPPAGSPASYGAPESPERQRSIQRQCAIKTAAEFLKACPESINEKAPVDTLLAVATAIDSWLTMPVIKSIKETTTKAAPKGDGAIEAIEEDVGF